jgi:radical SAM protein with 4Fe4S-binding SPASM domain
MRPSLAEVFIPGVNLTFRGSSFVFKSPETFKNDSRLKVHGLTAGDGQLFIDSTGRIMPSRAYPTDGGTIRSNHLLTVYRNSTLFKQLRSRRFIEGKCKLCPYLFICGGSRERAWTFNENPNAEEPLCNFAYFMKTRRN